LFGSCHVKQRSTYTLPREDLWQPQQELIMKDTNKQTKKRFL
jgi:hypothetical protein